MLLGVTLVGLSLTSFVVSQEKNRVSQERALELEHLAVQVRDSVESRMDVYTTALLGVRGLIEIGDDVSRSDFDSYVASSELLSRFPGTQAVEFAPLVLLEDIEGYSDSTRAEQGLAELGYPEFEVHPEPILEDSFIVDYLVPIEGNEAAWGFDLGSNPARREAVERARDTGLPVATEPITLVQETGSQRGYLLLVPVFEQDSQDPADFRGVVLAVFRVGDLLEGTVAGGATELTVFDGGRMGLEAAPELVFSSALSEGGSGASVSVEFAGRDWELIVHRGEEGHPLADRWWLLGLGGLVTTMAFAALILSVARGRDRAELQVKEATKELVTKNADLERSNADLERFAYVASHDLQTPVRNVRNSVELLGDVLPEDRSEEVEEYFGFLTKSSQRMEALIEGLLSYSRVGSRNSDEMMMLNLNEIAADVVDMFRNQLDEVDGYVEVSQLPEVFGDRTQIQQVFLNLIGNSVKYRDPDRPLHVRIEGSSSSQSCVFSVTDNGIGIEEKFHDAVFLMFRRLHRSEDYEGTGLGLAMCRRIIERHDGIVQLDSAPGRGTKVTIEMPIGKIEVQQ